MTSLDNLEKQLAFLKNSMENLDQPETPAVQEKTRNVIATSIYGANENKVKNVVKDTDDAATIKKYILGIIGPATDMTDGDNVQDYINKIHNDLDIEKEKAKAAEAASAEAAASATPAGVSQSKYDDAIRAKEAALEAKEAAIKVHKSDLKAIYTALAGLTKPLPPAKTIALADIQGKVSRTNPEFPIAFSNSFYSQSAEETLTISIDMATSSTVSSPMVRVISIGGEPSGETSGLISSVVTLVNGLNTITIEPPNYSQQEKLDIPTAAREYELQFSNGSILVNSFSIASSLAMAPTIKIH